jgi:D-psicose/D-tagatose/L-ribulose 3-epimerase
MGPLSQPLGYFSGQRPTKQEWKWSVDVCRAFGEYAAKKNMPVAIEPLNRFEEYILNTAEDAVAYVKDVGLDNVGLVMDTMHMNIEELDIAKALAYAMPHTIHIHISENNRGIPGTGHACGKEVFDVIKQADYKGWLTIEAFNEGAPSMQGPLHLWREFATSDDALARQGLAYIRSMMK